MAGKTALITGASAGIGYELARLFAEDGYDLVLVARREERLKRVAEELKGKSDVRIIARDLSKPGSADALYREIRAQNISIDVLVNNVGTGAVGYFHEIGLEKTLETMQLNVVTLTHLTRLFLEEMVKRGNGQIVNIASAAAFQPGPLMAVYFATKAYVLSFSEALANELQGTGVSVSVVCPGFTRTELTDGLAQQSKWFRRRMIDARTVAKRAYRGIKRKKTLILTEGIYRVLLILLRFAPRKAAPRVVRRMFQD